MLAIDDAQWVQFGCMWAFKCLCNFPANDFVYLLVCVSGTQREGVWLEWWSILITNGNCSKANLIEQMLKDSCLMKHLRNASVILQRLQRESLLLVHPPTIYQPTIHIPIYLSNLSNLSYFSFLFIFHRRPQNTNYWKKKVLRRKTYKQYKLIPQNLSFIAII